MGPEKWKDEVPKRQTSEQEKPGGESGAQHEAADPREDEGWSQPESSAQKLPPLPQQGSERGDPSER